MLDVDGRGWRALKGERVIAVFFLYMYLCVSWSMVRLVGAQPSISYTQARLYHAFLYPARAAKRNNGVMRHHVTSRNVTLKSRYSRYSCEAITQYATEDAK